MNACDGEYSSLDVHFTSLCDNNCSFCIDKGSNFKNYTPLVDSIVSSVIDNSFHVNDVLFLGGEPCLYLDELLDCVVKIKKYTNLKVYITSSIPKSCSDNYDIFVDLLDKVDGFNISAQHYDETIADLIRGTKSTHDRQYLYKHMPYKDKCRVNLNLVRPWLCTKNSIIECLSYYDSFGFGSIKLSELQNSEEYFISFNDIFKCSLKSPYSSGCQKFIDLTNFDVNIKTPVLLKRSCFLCEESQSASFMDIVKLMKRPFRKVKNYYRVIYGDGSVKKGWI